MILKSQPLQAIVLTKTIGAQAQFYFLGVGDKINLPNFLLKRKAQPSALDIIKRARVRVFLNNFNYDVSF